MSTNTLQKKQQRQREVQRVSYPLTRPESSIIQVNDNVREGHIRTIFPISWKSGERPRFWKDSYLFVEVAAFLAIEQFNKRSNEILPHLPETLRNCDLHITMEHRDSSFSSAKAVNGFIDTNCVTKIVNRFLQPTRELPKDNFSLFSKRNNSLSTVSQMESGLILKDDAPEREEDEKESFNDADSYLNQTDTDVFGIEVENSQECQPPFAFVGAGLSKVSKTLSILGYSMQLPLISPASTSSELDQYDFFSRTIPTNEGDARAVAMYLDHLKVSHVGIIYTRDSFGIAFYTDLFNQLHKLGISVYSVAIADDDASTDEEIETAVKQLAQFDVRYFVGILLGESETVMHYAEANKIMGYPGYTWLFTEGSSGFAKPTFSFDRETEQHMARALHGSAIILVDVQQYEPLTRALREFANNQTAQEEFISMHKLDSYDVPIEELSIPQTSFMQHFGFDAAMALAIAACETPGLFTGEELMQTLLQTEFEGASGFVSLNNQTGTRSPDNIPYSVYNIRLSEERSTATDFFFTAEKTSRVDISTNSIITLGQFEYADGTYHPPLPLPPLEENLNLITLGARLTGLTLIASMMIMSIGWMIWTWYHRNEFVVRASQPIFLCQLCVGTFIMASSVIPLSFQEPMSLYRLDIACMSAPWLLCIGFVTAFSALFSKLWRLNKLFSSGVGFRRIEVRPADVMTPFFILMAFNVLSLILWTIFYRLKWVRVPISDYDKFGRSIQSYGMCASDKEVVVMIVPLFAANFVGLAIACYQGYMARNISTDFSEAKYLSITIFCLLETIFLAIPLLAMIVGDPTANFLIQSIFMTLGCSSILLPVFLPKFKQRNTQLRRGGSRSNLSAVRSNVASSRHNTVESIRRGIGNKSAASSKDFESDNNKRTSLSGVSRIHRYDQYYEQTSSNFNTRVHSNSGINSSTSRILPP